MTLVAVRKVTKEDANTVEVDNVLVERRVIRTKDDGVQIYLRTSWNQDDYVVMAQLTFPLSGLYKEHKLHEVTVSQVTRSDPKAFHKSWKAREAYLTKHRRELNKQARAAARQVVEAFVGTKDFHKQIEDTYGRMAAAEAKFLAEQEKELAELRERVRRYQCQHAAYQLRGEEQDLALSMLDDWTGSPEELKEATKAAYNP